MLHTTGFLVIDLFTWGMFAEGQLESADIATLSSDHQFINADWLEPAETSVSSNVLC